MFHKFDIAVNSSTGVPMTDVLVRLFDGSDASVPIYADQSGTPIVSVSGVANAAKTDSDGNYSFYVADGTYTMRFYKGDSLILTVPNIDMKVSASSADLASSSGASLVGTSQGDTVEDRLAGISSAPGNITLPSPSAGTGWWASDTTAPRIVQNASRSFFGIPSSTADGQNSGTNWVSSNFDHYLIRSNTLTSLSVTGGTAVFGATRNGDRYRQPTLSTALTVWASGQTITSGQYRGYNGKRYQASNSGTTGATPPTHGSGTVSDGGVSWTYIDNRGQYFTPIAISGLAWSEFDDGEAVWGSYFDLTRGASGGLLFGVEYAVKNLGGNVVADPFTMLPAGGTLGAWFAGGGDASYGGSPTNPATVAIGIGRNASAWNTGILFGQNALATINGRARAIGLGPTHAIQWFRSASTPTFEIRSDGGVAGRETRVVSNGFTTEWRGVRPSGTEETIFSISQPDLSAANSRANQFYFDVSVTTGAAGTGWVKAQAAGYDTNVDFQFETKGAGVFDFRKNGVGTFSSTPNYVGAKSDSIIVAVDGSSGTPTSTQGAAGLFQKFSSALSYNTLAGLATKTNASTNARATGVYGEAVDTSGGTSTFVEGGRFQGILSSGSNGSAYGIIGAAGTNPSGPTSPAYLIGVEGEVTKQVGSDASTYGSFNINSFSAAFVATCGVGVASAKKADAAFLTNSYSVSKFRTGLLLSSAVDDTGVAAASGTSLSSGVDIHLATISYASFWAPNNAPIRFSNSSGTGWNVLNLDASNRLTLGQDASAISLGGSSTGFNSATPIAKPTISGSRSGNAALASVLTQLANYGLITDGTTA